MRRLGRPVLSVLLVVAVAACSDDGSETGVMAGDIGGTTPTTGGGAATDPTTTAPPATQSELLIQMRTGGGFVPVEAVFGALPEFTLFADGRVLVVGPTTLEYPGAALPNLVTTTLDDAGVQAAVDAAVKAGVGDKVDFGNLPVADAPTTTFTLRKDGRVVTSEVYALGFEDAPMLAGAQRENRRRFSELAERLRHFGATASEPYRADAVSVLVTPYPEPAPGDPAPVPAPATAAWPLGDLGAGGAEMFGGRCLGFAGADAARVLDAAAAARSNTRWTSAGKAWALTFRPDFPGTTPCAAAR